MLFDGWDDLGRLVVVGTLTYAGLVVLLRVTGKRTLSKMNAFDLVITVALGSTLSSALLSEDVSLSEGLGAFVLLCVLQFVVTYASVRSPTVQRLVKSEPAMVYFEGQYIESALKRERVTREEVMAAVRAHGIATMNAVCAVVLETDGAFSVIAQDAGKRDLLDPIRRG